MVRHRSNSPGQLRILVVDSDVDCAETLALLLSLYDYNVEIALDGFAALQLAETIVPDVVIFEIALPGMDGYHLARQMRKLPARKGLFLIAYTGYGQDRDRALSAAATIDLHLVKPAELERLRLLLDRFEEFIYPPDGQVPGTAGLPVS